MCLEYLHETCSFHDLHPRPMEIKLPNHPAGAAHCRGGFADVFKCTYRNQEVAIKVLRTYSSSDIQNMTRVSYTRPFVPLYVLAHLLQPMQRFYNELIVWSSLRHPNVLPLLGLLKDESRFKFAMVSEWMPNGNINEFVQMHREVNPFVLVCILFPAFS